MQPVKRGITAPANSIAVTSPVATQIGDLMVFFLTHATSSGADLTHTIQAGFTQITSVFLENGVEDMRTSVAYKIATLSGAQSYTPFTGPLATRSIGMIVFQVGTFDVSTLPNSASFQELSINPPTAPVLADLSGDYCILAHGSWRLSGIFASNGTPPAGYFEEWDHSIVSAFFDHILGSKFISGLSSGSETPGVFTDTHTSVLGSIGITVAIKGFQAPGDASLNQTFEPLDATGTATVVGNTAQANLTFRKLQATGAIETNWLEQFIEAGLSDAVEVQEDGSTLKPLV